jgi:hypothetical protein
MKPFIKLALKIIPISEIVRIAWSVIDPILQKKVDDSESTIDDNVYKELKAIINKIIQGLTL